MADDKKITITVPAAELDQALKISSGPTAAIVRALRIANYVDRISADGERLVVQDRDGKVGKELRFL